MSPHDWLNEQGPWNFDDESLCEELRRALKVARQLARRAEDAERQLRAWDRLRRAVVNGVMPKEFLE